MLRETIYTSSLICFYIILRDKSEILSGLFSLFVYTFGIVNNIVC